MAMFEIHCVDEQIKALPTVDTASGAIATFDTDLTENLVEVKCQIVAKQASGTPSPVNPLPITTYTEMNVFATGKNLLPNVKWQVNTNRVEIGRDNVNDTIHLKSGTYTIKVDCDIVATIYYLNNGSTVSLGNTTEARTLILSEDIDTIFWVYKSGGVSVNDVHDFQLEQGNEATTYAPYNGTTLNIPFGQTVANGVLDITTGKLRVTDGYATFDGSESWSVYSTYNYHYQINLPNVLRNGGVEINSYSSHFTGRSGYANNNASITEGIFSADGNRIRFKNTDCSDLTAWINFVTTQYNNGTPVQVVYKLATPIEIQLDSITLQALLNENNIWCDTGDTEVKFLLTVGKKIS